MSRSPNRLVGAAEQDRINARIYLSSMDKLKALPNKIAIPSMGIRWLCERYGYDEVIESLRGPQGGNVPNAVLYELRFCASWLSQHVIRNPPSLEALPSIWDDVKTLHVCSYDPDVMDRIVRTLGRMKRRAEALEGPKVEH